MAQIAGSFSRGTQIAWEGDITPPVVSYAYSAKHTALLSGLRVPASNAKTKSSVVNRVPIRRGINYFYSVGGREMPIIGVPTPGAGGVRNTAFQPILVQLKDWVINTGWRMAGYPRNLEYTFRVGQLKTQYTGGAGPGVMVTKPVFPGVQTVPRYAAITRKYPTRSAKA